MDSAVKTPTMTATTPTLAAEAKLTAADRCDRCGAQAYVRATLPGGSDLLMCGHHAHENREKLLAIGAYLHDETENLTVKRESGFGG